MILWYNMNYFPNSYILLRNLNIETPEDGVQDAETCSGDIELYLYVSNTNLYQMLTNKNSIQEKIKNSLKLGNACYY